MTVKDLEALFDYSYWANAKLFEVVAQLTSEEFTKPLQAATALFGTHWFMS